MVSNQAADTLIALRLAERGDRRRAGRCDRVHPHARSFNPNTMLALRTLVNDIGNEMAIYKELKHVPADRTPNFRNDMYLVSEALRLMQKSGQPAFAAADVVVLDELQEAHRQRHQVHPALGEGGGGDGSRAWAPWWAGSASSSRWARRSAKTI